MLDLPQPELHVVQARALAVSGQVLAGAGEHFGGHVHADHPPGRTNLWRGDEGIEPRAAPQVQQHLSRLERSDGAGVAAGQANVRAPWQRGQFFGRVADMLGQRVRIHLRHAATATRLAPVAAVFRDLRVAGAHRLAHRFLVRYLLIHNT